MRAALSRQGWHNYTLFLRDDGLLFGYVEVPDTFDTFDTALNGMPGEAINAQWQTYMDGFFEIPPGRLADQAMVTLEEVFHLD